MKLATIECIKNKRECPDSDRLDLVNVLGYQCVTQRDLYNDGDLAVYIKTDTLLPVLPWAEEYLKYSPDRVRAVKIRNQWSEGILVPLDIITEFLGEVTPDRVGEDVSELLGVEKFSFPDPIDKDAESAYLPYRLHRTDEPRWEDNLDRIPLGQTGDVFIKDDGQSITFGYHIGDDYHFLINRNNLLLMDRDNKYTRLYKEYNIAERLKAYCLEHNVSLALRGEMFGKGISSSGVNPHSKIDGLNFELFSVYNLDTFEYERKGSRFYFRNVGKEMGLPMVKLLRENVIIDMELIHHYSSGIDVIDGVKFEGVVVQTENTSFKIINKYYDSRK